MGASAAVYATIEKLVRALLDQLISHILGGEVPKIDRKKKQKVRIAAIGHVTAKKLLEYGIQTECMPMLCDLSHMAEALEECYRIENQDE